MEKKTNSTEPKLRFDGIYISFNVWHEEPEGIDYDLVFQFYEDGSVGFGDIPHILDSPGIREFINQHVIKLRKKGKNSQEIKSYYNEMWFYDLLKHNCEKMGVEYVKFDYIDGTYEVEKNHITIKRGTSIISKTYSGLIKKDALDLHVTYSFTNEEDNDLYEFIAFNYE